jgi:DNA processing protein
LNDLKPYWVGFNLVRGIGAQRLRALLNAFGDVRTAWHAQPGELMAAGLTSKIVQSLLQVRSSVDLEKVLQRLEKQGVTVLTWEDETYPRLLREIDQPPPVLYVRGEISTADEWAVGVVGTRRVTAYGRQVTEELCAALAGSGVTVVSGLARGVDAIAHQTALRCGGRTIAVLGSGVDRIYPPEHRRLAAQIAESGAVISDYPPGTAPDAANFPPRNRIISGLARAVVVVEAGQVSGALITASFAAEQGRDVFAVPGNINAPQSKGTNDLIRQGARPLLTPQDVLETLNLEMVNEQRSARSALPADAYEAKLYEVLGKEPLHIDEIRLQTNLPIEKVTATLALMELKGMVRQVGGMHYIAVHEEQAEYNSLGGS